MDRKLALGGYAVPVKLLVAGVMAALAAAVGAGFLARQLVTSSGGGSPASKSRIPKGFVEFRDRGAGFSIAYPESWTRFDYLRDKNVRLLAGQDADTTFRVQVVPLSAAVSANNLASAKPFTDKLIRSGKHVKLIDRTQVIKLGGMPGFLYVYTVRDPQTRRIGAHAHYFVFRGRRMISLVFEAQPAARLAGLAPTFQRIATTLRS